MVQDKYRTKTNLVKDKRRTGKMWDKIKIGLTQTLDKTNAGQTNVQQRQTREMVKKFHTKKTQMLQYL